MKHSSPDVQTSLAQSRLAAIVESSDDAIISKDLNGIITSWNRGAERIFGYTAAEAIGQPVTMLIPPDRSDEEPGILARVRRGERVDHYQTVRRSKDGSLVDISLSISPIADADGTVIGASKIARDITKEKRAEEAQARLLESERQARSIAEAAIRTKDEFLSVVSHELRTPLASILGWVNVLKSGATGEKAARALQTIERSGRAQARLIEDLLDASRMITGQMRLNLRLVDLSAAVRQAVDTIRPTAEAKGVRLDAQLDDCADPVVGDADRLQQIAWNLLSNAVKFTPAGGTVAVRLGRRETDVCLTVHDTGRGIAREFLPHVFERFRQADHADSRRSGGLGLGLAIVRHLVELHGGEVAATSEGDGLGATFTATLPRSSLDMDLESDAMPRPLLGIRALVIDDDFHSQNGLRLVLERHGARVTVAGSVREARELLYQSAPDIVVSDIRLPDEDGYAFLRWLRTIDRFRFIPAIAITGLDGEDRIEQAIAAGYGIRLGKPVDAVMLVNAAANLIAQARTP